LLRTACDETTSMAVGLGACLPGIDRTGGASGLRKRAESRGSRTTPPAIPAKCAPCPQGGRQLAGGPTAQVKANIIHALPRAMALRTAAGHTLSVRVSARGGAPIGKCPFAHKNKTLIFLRNNGQVVRHYRKGFGRPESLGKMDGLHKILSNNGFHRHTGPIVALRGDGGAQARQNRSLASEFLKEGNRQPANSSDILGSPQKVLPRWLIFAASGIFAAGKWSIMEQIGRFCCFGRPGRLDGEPT
jgi:hypothetical protein